MNLDGIAHASDREPRHLDCVRTVKKKRQRVRGKVSERKMEKNTMKWLSRLRLPKSFRAPIRRPWRKERVDCSPSVCSATSPGGEAGGDARGQRVSGRWDWMVGGGDAEGFRGRGEGGRGGEVTLLHQYFGLSLCLFLPRNLPSNAAPTGTSTKTHRRTNHLQPPRRKVIRVRPRSP